MIYAYILIITRTTTAANDNVTQPHASGMPHVCHLISIEAMAGA